MPADRKPRLLIAEDDRTTRELIVLAARRSDAFSEIHSVEDGSAALDWVHHCLAEALDHVPDVVLTDFKMPRINGVELTRRLKAAPQTRWIPVAMMSSTVDPRDEAMAMTAGCDAFFQRPRGLKELLVVLQNVTGLSVKVAPGPAD